MSSNVKSESILEGLSCANCATNIEVQIKNIPEIKNVNVNFALKKLKIEVNNKEELDKVFEEVKVIIKNIEPDIKIINIKESNTDESNTDESNKNIEIIKLCIGSILFVFGLVLNVPTWMELTIFLISYIIVGSDIVIKALKNILRGKIFDENFLMSIATIGAFIVGQFPEVLQLCYFIKLESYFKV